MALLQVKGISKIEKEKLVVDDISFYVQPQQKIAIAGATGSGKTTLLKIVAGLIEPNTGEVFFNGKKVLGPNEQLIAGHPKIAYLSQHFELLNNYRVDTLLERSNQFSNEDADEIYIICKIEHLLKRKTNELSGGEKQRIALALQLIKNPQLLILDEPFSNLDFIHKSIIKKVIEDAYFSFQFSCILVSHEASDILSWSDDIFIMQNGKIVQQDNPQNIYYHPINEYCAGLLGSYNVVDLHSKLYTLNNNNTILRPERICIESNANKGLEAYVQHIVFWGSYYTIDVVINNQTLTIKTLQCNVSIGEKIYISIANNNK